MNISSVTNSTSTASYTTGNSSSDEISQLQKEKARLQSQLSSISSSKVDEKTKEEKTKAIQTEINQIEEEISQKQASKSKGNGSLEVTVNAGNTFSNSSGNEQQNTGNYVDALA